MMDTSNKQPAAESVVVTTISAKEFVAMQEYYKEAIRTNRLQVTCKNRSLVDVCGRIDGQVGIVYEWPSARKDGVEEVEPSSTMLVVTAQPPPAERPHESAVVEELQSAAESLHDQYLTEKDRYQSLYRDYMELHDMNESDTSFVIDTHERLFGFHQVNNEDGSSITFDEAVEHWERETIALRLSLATAEMEAARLRETVSEALTLLKTVAPYSNPRGYFIACKILDQSLHTTLEAATESPVSLGSQRNK